MPDHPHSADATVDDPRERLRDLCWRLRRHEVGNGAAANAIATAHGWSSAQGRAAERTFNIIYALTSDIEIDYGVERDRRCHDGRPPASAAAAVMLQNEAMRPGRSRRLRPLTEPEGAALDAYLDERAALLDEIEALERPLKQATGQAYRPRRHQCIKILRRSVEVSR
jgi:hypothetical protein